MTQILWRAVLAQSDLSANSECRPHSQIRKGSLLPLSLQDALGATRAAASGPFGLANVVSLPRLPEVGRSKRTFRAYESTYRALIQRESQSLRHIDLIDRKLSTAIAAEDYALAVRRPSGP